MGSLPRVSVVLGGANALHKEATKRGLQLEPTPAMSSAEGKEKRDKLMEPMRSSLKAAAEAMPPADVMGARIGSFFKRGAKTAGGLTHGLSFSKAKQQAEQAAQGAASVFQFNSTAN